MQSPLPPVDAPAVKRHRSEGSGSPPAADAGTEEEPGTKPRPVSRWSDGKYRNTYVPSYIPPELVIFDNGSALDLLLTRAKIEDCRRLGDRGDPELFFQRRGGRQVQVAARFDSSGARLNTSRQILHELREKSVREILDRARRHNRQKTEKEIVKRVYFTAAQMESKAYGAILGSRGATHQKLEAETGCRIVLGGQGITDLKKAINLRHMDRSVEMANDRPHCRITAPSESALQKAVERIEWILSDTPAAIRFRDENRKRLAMDNGTYDPKTWVPTPIPGEAVIPEQQADDAEVDELFALVDV